MLPTDESIPWTVRLEFGFDTGWGLPTPEQWEKACRSDDGRVFPWGKEAASHAHSWFVRDAPLPAKLMGWPRDQDMSPYGVRAMGSNVSEWVAYASNEWCFAKGGAYPFSGTYADARRIFGSDQGRPTTWIGLRVVKVPR